jgi:hypothetical protein
MPKNMRLTPSYLLVEISHYANALHLEKFYNIGYRVNPHGHSLRGGPSDHDKEWVKHFGILSATDKNFFG